MHPRNDRSPVWSADGSKLGFVSDRNNADYDIWFTWLKKEDWEKTKRDWEEEDEEEEKSSNGKNNGEKKDSTETFTIEIDFEGIHDRLEQVTAYPGNEGGVEISKDGETFYFSANGSGRNGRSTMRNFMSIKWDGTDSKVILDDMPLGNMQWDDKYKNLYFVSRGKFNKLPVSGKKVEGQPFTAKLEIDHPGERAQMFEDAWRALRDGFYDPEFHGEDWEDLKKKYKMRALAASTSQDFRTMFNEMLGQLNASHMGMYGSDPEDLQRDQTGLIGVELKTVPEGVQVTYIIPDSPADKEGSKLAVGEIITSVNGEQIVGNTNFFSLMEGTANERTLLTVKASDGASREVIIRPVTSLNAEKYEAWIKEQKRLTDLYSGGKLGYIHIRAMGWPSFERFERELMASGFGKEGIVIDVRYNGGGWTTDMLMAVLTTRQHAYTIPRGAAKSLKDHKKFKNNYPYGERLPFPPLMMPSVALCNENSYSNAEIFSHAYKTLGLGTLVGQPTFGAVISTGSYGLVDGGRVRMPFRAWFVKATEENMEHGPAVPDVLVENAPDGKAAGKDDQLKKAVEILMEQINK
jgi:C-terminal processing protease CtpA/Prc